MKRRWILAVLTVLACGGAGASTGSTPYVEASLEITYQHPDVETYSYSVTCGDGRASIRGIDLDAEAACDNLSELGARSRLVEGPPDQACPDLYGGADVVTVKGTLAGEQVEAMIDRMDGCGISDWDNLLGNLLPPPRGEASSA
ncbi:MAG: hypothetical protein ACLFWM_03825 [Actinomycetota bacterium]